MAIKIPLIFVYRDSNTIVSMMHLLLEQN
jgi:hypothetical protein